MLGGFLPSARRITHPGQQAMDERITPVVRSQLWKSPVKRNLNCWPTAVSELLSSGDL